MKIDLTGKCAIVTGGGTGIGRAISIGLAENGASVVVNYSRSKAEDTVAEITRMGGKACAAQADVTDEVQVISLVETAVTTFSGLDILVANAGGRTIDAPSADLTRDQWAEGIDLNCTSVFLRVKHAAPRLPDGSGRFRTHHPDIVNQRPVRGHSRNDYLCRRQGRA